MYFSEPYSSQWSKVICEEWAELFHWKRQLTGTAMVSPVTVSFQTCLQTARILKDMTGTDLDWVDGEEQST